VKVILDKDARDVTQKLEGEIRVSYPTYLVNKNSLEEIFIKGEENVIYHYFYKYYN